MRAGHMRLNRFLCSAANLMVRMHNVLHAGFISEHFTIGEETIDRVGGRICLVLGQSFLLGS